jgi:hypothetical protein
MDWYFGAILVIAIQSLNCKRELLELWWGLEIEFCREYFRKLKILPLQSQYIYSLLLFVINNRQHFKINSDIHNIKARKNLDFYYPQARLSVYQKGAHYTGIKLSNRLPGSIKQLSHDPKQFQTALKGFFLILFIPWTNILNTR